jgi:hypothetical protein
MQYCGMSSAGTPVPTSTRRGHRAELPWNLSIPSTTLPPHRPSSSDGQSSIFVSSNPIGRRYRLSRTARRYARLSRPTGGFGSAAAEGRCGAATAAKPTTLSPRVPSKSRTSIPPIGAPFRVSGKRTGKHAEPHELQWAYNLMQAVPARAPFGFRLDCRASRPDLMLQKGALRHGSSVPGGRPRPLGPPL